MSSEGHQQEYFLYRLQFLHHHQDCIQIENIIQMPVWNIWKIPCEICYNNLSILIKVLDPTFVLDDELVNWCLAGDEKRGWTDCRRGEIGGVWGDLWLPRVSLRLIGGRRGSQDQTNSPTLFARKLHFNPWILFSLNDYKKHRLSLSTTMSQKYHWHQ